MEKKFDLVVIGTGAGGSTVAHKCRKAGWEVAIIDSRPFGGTCALRGCDPKKVLVGAAELIDWNQRMRGKGITAGTTEIEWEELMRFKKTFTEPVPDKRENNFAGAGIAAFHGRARFLDKTTVQIGDDTLTGRYAHIAAGAKPAPLGISGEEYLTDSTAFLEMEKLPKRIIFVGGGYIAFEFAHIASRAGANVQILHRGARSLEGFDPDLVDTLDEATRDLGIDLRLNTTVESVEKDGAQFIVNASAENSQKNFEADMVVHSAGRVPDIDDLDLERAGIERCKKGIRVNEYLQSVSNPLIYAAGDAADSGGLPLTPVATMEGHIAASNLLNGNHHQPNYLGIPTVVFTLPPLALVGLREDEAAKQGLKFKVKHEDTSGWYSSRRIGLKYSGYKTLVEEETNRILGAHLLGVHAEEVINIFALAVRAGLKEGDLKTMIYAYPTSASDISYMV
ncbi:MAG: dihydrolipoyl dehydrogenase family protein [Pyrinomonadaceae bacterium]